MLHRLGEGKRESSGGRLLEDDNADRSDEVVLQSNNGWQLEDITDDGDDEVLPRR